MQRVAEHCPVHSTIGTIDDVEMNIIDTAEMATLAELSRVEAIVVWR